MPRKFDRFDRGGVITCIICGKRTRETGNGESSLEMCGECIELSGSENSLIDNGREYMGEAFVTNFNTLLKKVQERCVANGKEPYIPWIPADLWTMEAPVAAPAMSRKDLLECLNDHRVALGYKPYKLFVGTTAALQAELERVERVAALGGDAFAKQYKHCTVIVRKIGKTRRTVHAVVFVMDQPDVNKALEQVCQNYTGSGWELEPSAGHLNELPEGEQKQRIQHALNVVTKTAMAAEGR